MQCTAYEFASDIHTHFGIFILIQHLECETDVKESLLNIKTKDASIAMVLRRVKTFCTFRDHQWSCYPGRFPEWMWSVGCVFTRGIASFAISSVPIKNDCEQSDKIRIVISQWHKMFCNVLSLFEIVWMRLLNDCKNPMLFAANV